MVIGIHWLVGLSCDQFRILKKHLYKIKINMEKIYFDKTTFIWKKKLNFSNNKEVLLREVYSLMERESNVKNDAYSYKIISNSDANSTGELQIQKEMNKISHIGINYCKEIHNKVGLRYNKINLDTWVNVVRSKNPTQLQFKHKELKHIDKFHSHTELNKKSKLFFPHYTYVYYIQMPDVMEEEDGVLYFKGRNGNEYWIRPEEDDLIIMEADMPHAPNNAPNANIDRIVLAGNVGFDYIKKEKTLF
jgi:hypothetical protein